MVKRMVVWIATECHSLDGSTIIVQVKNNDEIDSIFWSGTILSIVPEYDHVV